MLQAMIDESDSHDEKPRVFVMGGYLATVSQWEKLTDAWQAVLDQSPRIRYFSFKEAFPKSGKPNGQFHNFTVQERDDRVACFRRIIEDCVEAEVGIGFRMEAYERAYSWNKKRAANPYTYALPTLLIEVARNIEEIGVARQQIDFIFDKKDIEEPKVLAGWYEAKEIMTPNPPDIFEKIFLNAPAFRDDETDVIALQAADMFAGLNRAGNVAHLNGREPLNLPGVMKSIRGLFITPTDDQLRDHAEGIRQRIVESGRPL